MRSEKKLYLAWRGHRLMGLINHVIFETDRDGHWVFLNPAWEEATGYTVAASVGNNLLEYLHPQDRDQGRLLLQQLLENEEKSVQEALRFRKADGDYVWFEVFARLSYSEDGQLLGVAGTLTNAPEHKKRDEQRDTERQALEDLVENRTSELRDRLRYEQGLLASIHALSSGEPEPMVAALRHLRVATGADRVCLFANEQSEAGIFRAWLTAETCVPRLTARPDTVAFSYEAAGLSRWAQELSQGRPITGLLADFPGQERALWSDDAVLSLLILPVMVDGAWYGFLSFEDVERERQWKEDSISLLQTAADMLGAHVGRRRREGKVTRSLERREKQVALASRVAAQIATSTLLDELYAWLVQEINKTFGYYHTQLLLYERHEEAVVLVSAAGSAHREFMTEGRRVPVSEGYIGEVVASRRSMLRSDLQGASPWRPDPLLPATRGMLAVPIALSDEILGVLVVYSNQPGQLDQEDRLFLEGVSNQIATATDSVRLRQEMEERLAELNNLQRLISREGWLRLQTAREEGVLGYRYDRRTLEPLSDAGPEGSEASTPNGDGGKHRKRRLTARLQVRGETFGVLGVEDDPDAPLSDEERELLQAVSQQVAEAMEHARLLEQTQKRAVELETVARVSAATSTILESDKLLQAVVELAKRSFNLYHAHIYLLNEETNHLVLAAGSGEAGANMVEQKWHIPLDHPRSVVARAAREKEGIIVNDVRREAGFLPNPLLPATRSELALPMIASNRLLGVLDVQSDAVNYFTQDDVRIQSALAGQVATALQNATLYQEQLETAEKLREFDRLKSEFLASMSHELRTPLNSIIGFADVLLEGIDGELNERMEEDVMLIRNSGQHLRALIGDILDMSKIEAGMMDLRYEALDVPAMAREIEAFARTQLMTYEKELEFRLHIGPEVGTVQADRTRFKQVLYNLVSNAIKFTAEGQVKLSMTVRGGKLLVEISDTGIGIKEENIPIVFEQFRQVDGSLTRKAGGTGLGLPISKSLVELHQGKIWVESEVGTGTTFSFTIPVQQPERRKRDSG